MDGVAGQAAMEAVFVANRARLLIYAARLVGGAAEDVYQEAFLRAWRHAAALDHDRALLSYAYLVVHSCACNWRRRRCNSEIPTAEVEKPSADPQALAVDRAFEAELRAALAQQLPTRTIAFLNLTLAGYTDVEISRGMRVHLAVVKSAKFRARQRMLKRQPALRAG